MSDETREVAQRLYNKLTRENKKAVVTVGIGKAVTQKPVLVAYCSPDFDVQVPELFEGYVVLKTTGTAKRA